MSQMPWALARRLVEYIYSAHLDTGDLSLALTGKLYALFKLQFRKSRRQAILW